MKKKVFRVRETRLFHLRVICAKHLFVAGVVVDVVAVAVVDVVVVDLFKYFNSTRHEYWFFHR